MTTNKVEDLAEKARRAGVIGIFQLKVKKVQKTRSITDEGVTETHSAELIQEKKKDAPGVPIELKLKHIPEKMFSHGAKILITFQDAQCKLDEHMKSLDGNDEQRTTKEKENE